MVEIKANSHSFEPPLTDDDHTCFVGFYWDGEYIEFYGHEAWDLIQKVDVEYMENVPEKWERLTEEIKSYLEL